MTPLLKSQLKDQSKLKSYRPIVSTNVLMNMLEKVILMVWGKRVLQNSLQLGYTKGTGTTQCTWLLMEAIDHYRNNGTNLWVITLDGSMAFDMVKWNLLFLKIREQLPSIISWMILHAFRHQVAWVLWGDGCSNNMDISNGTGQGKTWSPIFWMIYLAPLLFDLRKTGVGVHMVGVFLGFLAYADDLLLLCPSRYAATLMIRNCEDWSQKYGITFSTDPDPSKSKTKVMVVGSTKKSVRKLCPLQLNGTDLPFVQSIKHLGHTITSEGDMEEEIRHRHGEYIQRVMELREETTMAHPREFLFHSRQYCNDLYISGMWRLDSKETRKVFNCWDVTIKGTYRLPRNTHKYLALGVGGDRTIKEDLMSRSLKFIRNLLSSPSMEVRVIAFYLVFNIRSTIGSNVEYLRKECGEHPLHINKQRMMTLLDDKLEVDMDRKENVALLTLLLEERLMTYYSEQCHLYSVESSPLLSVNSIRTYFLLFELLPAKSNLIISTYYLFLP